MKARIWAANTQLGLSIRTCSWYASSRMSRWTGPTAAPVPSRLGAPFSRYSIVWKRSLRMTPPVQDFCASMAVLVSITGWSALYQSLRWCLQHETFQDSRQVALDGFHGSGFAGRVSQVRFCWTGFTACESQVSVVMVVMFGIKNLTSGLGSALDHPHVGLVPRTTCSALAASARSCTCMLKT